MIQRPFFPMVILTLRYRTVWPRFLTSPSTELMELFPDRPGAEAELAFDAAGEVVRIGIAVHFADHADGEVGI